MGVVARDNYDNNYDNNYDYDNAYNLCIQRDVCADDVDDVDDADEVPFSLCDIPDSLNRVFLIKIFAICRKISHCKVFKTYALLHGLYRWCISIMLVPVTIPLILVSFLYFIVQGIFFGSAIVLLSIVECVTAKDEEGKEKFHVRSPIIKLMCAACIALIYPLVILCMLIYAITIHVTHGFLFHRYVGSLDKKSSVLFHYDDNKIYLMRYVGQLINKLQGKIIE